jgi:hypothetical protein
MFLSDFPGFTDSDGNSLVPSAILEMFVEMGISAVSTRRYGKAWRYQIGLFVAHYCTKYLKTYAESSASPQAAAALGSVTGILSSASLGDASVSYDTSAASKAIEAFGDFNTTEFGRQFATLAKAAFTGGSYIV